MSDWYDPKQLIPTMELRIVRLYSHGKVKPDILEQKYVTQDGTGHEWFMVPVIEGDSYYYKPKENSAARLEALKSFPELRYEDDFGDEDDNETILNR